VLARLYEEERASFGSRPAAARKLLAVGEHPRDPKVPLADAAAYTMVANTLLSLDATVTKR
jgi:hypothetical protein